MRWPIVGALVMLVALASPAGADPPVAGQPGAGTASAPGPATGQAVPWGKEADGLVCRLLVDPDYCTGQPVSVVVEIKNVSKRRRYLVDVFGLEFSRFSRLEGTGPKGKLKPNRTVERVIGPGSFRPIEPGEIKRIEFADISGVYYAGLGKQGRYTLRYSYTGVKPAKRMAVGIRETGSGKEWIHAEVPDEVVRNAWGGTVTSNLAGFAIVPPGKDDLQVHEWGVFTVYNDRKYANLDHKAEWESLPKGFYRQFPHPRLRWAPAVWRKPILYFYSQRPCLKTQVQVSFGEGVPVVWWPCCSAPVDQRVGGSARAPLFYSLTWSAWIGEKVPAAALGGLLGHENVWAAVQETEDFKDCWLAGARIKGPSAVTVIGSKVQRSTPRATNRVETERFIYYDGLVPSPDFLRCTQAAKDSVTLKNAAGFRITDLFVVDRRDTGAGGAVRFGRIEKPIPAGGQSKIELRHAAADWPAPVARPLRDALLKAGLFAPETDALLKVWREGFFYRPGLTAFYLLPREEYDRMLPLTITPKPAAVVRVGIAIHPTLEGEPVLLRRAAELIKKLDSNEYKEREAASAELAGMGPVASRLLEETLKKTTSEEVRHRCRAILDHADASTYLLTGAPPPK